MRVPSPNASPDPTAFDRRAWITLLVLCGVLFLDGLDVSMVGVALPSIDADLNLSTSTLQWVVSGYVLGYGGLLLLGGRTADLLGRRRVLLVALGVFAGASLLGALVDSGPLLIAARFIKGAAAGFTAPAGLSIITTTFPEGPLRNRALGIYTATGASGFSLGLVLGGVLTTAGWRWTFLLPFPIAVVLLIVAARVLRPDPPRTREGRFDLAGAVSVTGAMLALVFGVSGAPDAGWASAQTLGALAAAAALFSALPRDRAARRAPARAARDPALPGDRGREPRRHDRVRVLLRLPVHDDALHAAGCSAGRRWRRRSRSSRRACSSRSAPRAWARSPRASAPRR